MYVIFTILIYISVCEVGGGGKYAFFNPLGEWIVGFIQHLKSCLAYYGIF